ncbi:hypothetical protein MMAGJ_21170 [Mycolicibacterium mageritense]|uniref:Uncharacterized protein n=1 Tax=Mycolicibacterium mageritense TaxID=53462 RepID=A0ABM7HQM0_MYCME|nr:hypothetical protein MMAGJ_21170 [Mycolicibacterium mageritense]
MFSAGRCGGQMLAATIAWCYDRPLWSAPLTRQAAAGGRTPRIAQRSPAAPGSERIHYYDPGDPEPGGTRCPPKSSKRRSKHAGQVQPQWSIVTAIQDIGIDCRRSSGYFE